MNSTRLWLLGLVALLSVVIFGFGILLACGDDDDDDNDDSGDDDAADDDAADDDATDDDAADDDDDSADDCMSQFGSDMLSCVSQVGEMTRKEGAECVLTTMDDLIACLTNGGLCDAMCECLDGCTDTAWGCIDPCGDNDDPCLDACDTTYNDCILNCGWDEI